MDAILRRRRIALADRLKDRLEVPIALGETYVGCDYWPTVVPNLVFGIFDFAVVVTNPEISSVRDSDRIIGLLDAKTERAKSGERMEKHLLLARYDPVRAGRGDMLRVEDVVEILSIPLLGIIPESEEVLRASNLGSPVTISNPKCAPALAYQAAAQRLMGIDVPIAVPSERKGLLNKLLGRRAA